MLDLTMQQRVSVPGTNFFLFFFPDNPSPILTADREMQQLRASHE